MKNYIIDNNLLNTILEQIGCHNIKDSGSYVQCSNPDGDNPKAITVYKDNLKVIDYTRQIENNSGFADIITLVQFFHNINFFLAIKQICKWVGIDYYYDFNKDLPSSIQITKLLVSLQSANEDSEIEETVKPISEKILTYYKPYVNDLFYNDNITYEIQYEFEIGYDQSTDYISIPIRDEIGTLVGVKGRIFKTEVEKDENKYIYLERCSRRQILYGLYKSIDTIKLQGTVYVVEAEKGVLQMFSYGYKNVVATGGKKISQIQLNKLSRLCVDIVFLFDKDVQQEEIVEISKRIIGKSRVYAVFDSQDKPILSEKESPTDNLKKLKHLLENNMVKLRG